MEGYGYRLDCSPYLGGALETKILLEKLPLRKDKLHTLTDGFAGGIYNGPQFVRNYVESGEYGVPFMTGSTMQLADLGTLPLLSKRDAHGPKLAHLELQPGLSLISCSGTIGKMAYARREMANVWSSQDILKVVADPAKIASGYLYAYLCSKFGIPLVASGTYGAIIQHLEPEHIWDLPVPRLGDALEYAIHALVEEAAKLRCRATEQIHAVRRRLVSHFGQPPTPARGTRHAKWAGHAIGSEWMSRIGRMDALFYNPLACELDEWIGAHPSGFVELGSIARVFDVPPFKHIYVNPAEGIGFFTSADIFLLEKKPDKYLSKTSTKGLERYVLERGWVLLARSGSLGGNIAIPQFADSAMAGKTASDHVIRIAAKTKEFSPGYLYAFLSLRELGYPLILRSATGACIPALWPVYLNGLRVLKPTASLNEEVNDAIQTAFEVRVTATSLEDKARELLESSVESSVV
jgi:type I restriction enzyme S subunit